MFQDSPCTTDKIYAGAALLTEQPLFDCGRKIRLIAQSDGNLVLYYGAAGIRPALWSSGTSQRPDGFCATHLTLQPDGNLVLYEVGGAALWDSGTVGKEADRLVVQGDCNLVLYGKGHGPGTSVLWTSGTSPCPSGPVPPPAPHIPSTPVNWPVFADVSALEASPAWANYFSTVYNMDMPPSAFPLHVGALWFLYNLPLPTSSPAIIGACPTAATAIGQRYFVNNRYSPQHHVSYLWQAPPYAAVPASSWVEVMRQADPFGDEHHGAWFVLAWGSGVYLHVGRTISFDEHADAYSHFGVASGENEKMCEAAAASGYDTIQFVAHIDHFNYPCDSHNTGVAGMGYMNVEVVATRLVGTYACGDKAGRSDQLRAGWGASRPCECDNSRQNVNCGGLAQLLPSLAHGNASAGLHA